jgi:asparagine synthase (glutamine-hydrolysing)
VGSTCVLGQAHARSGLLRASGIAQRLDAIEDRDLWLAEVATLNGSFAVVACRNGELRAAVDRLRCFPLFYTRAGSVLRISDAASKLVGPEDSGALDPECRMEFEYTGYVTGEETLVSGLRQIRAGHALFMTTTSDARQVRYYAFRHPNPDTRADSVLISELVGVHERVFRRLIEDVGDRQFVLPLSGGYDSRLIAHSLHTLGARNVLCYTYGLAGNWESEISRQLAEHLGFDWVMLPYSAERWRTVAGDPLFERYFVEAANFASLAHIQDWPAVEMLVAQNRITPDAVFVPGHSGDFLAGSHVPKRFANQLRIDRNDLLQAIFDAHYMLWDWPPAAAAEMKRTFAGRIERVLGTLHDGDAGYAADFFECWDCEERQAKFIVNSVRTYEWFGFQWRLPLFDAELMDFWSRVNLEGRRRRRLYFEFVQRHQRLPITNPNTDRGPMLRTGIRLIEASGLGPLAMRMRRELKRLGWRREYARGSLGWFALVERGEFRKRYSGRENGHAFFALMYLERMRLQLARAPDRRARE